jgi:hypothetical protein
MGRNNPAPPGMPRKVGGYDPLVGLAGGNEEPDREQDPFEGLTLDEDFIRAAPFREPAAAERQRAARQANLSRLLSDEGHSRDERPQAYRRLPPLGGAEGEFEDWEPPVRRRRRTPVRAVGLLVIVAMVMAYVVSDYIRTSGRAAPGTATAGASAPNDRTAPGSPAAPGSVMDDSPAGDSTIFTRPEDWPPLPDDVSPQPLGEPGPVPGGGGPHSFALTQRDGVTPVGYDPCRPVRFVTRGEGPAGGQQMVREAVAMVSEATGLLFVDEGGTTEVPSEGRPSYQPDRYGERWAPVLIAWSDAVESPKLGEVSSDQPLVDVAGYAGSQSVGLSMTDPRNGETTDTGYVFVTGQVVLDRDDLTAMADGPDGYARARAVVAHELAHLVGLGHVEDPAQLMHPAARPWVTGFGSGDLEGLARLGRLDCFPQI